MGRKVRRFDFVDFVFCCQSSLNPKSKLNFYFFIFINSTIIKACSRSVRCTLLHAPACMYFEAICSGSRISSSYFVRYTTCIRIRSFDEWWAMWMRACVCVCECVTVEVVVAFRNIRCIFWIRNAHRQRFRCMTLNCSICVCARLR